ncbi:MAG: Hsp20/alpha crystallin family protein [Actinobacteria bacterium]|nr:Hsp20/alpha crystallin family protein [Actinomycetota bacterium]
MTTTLVRRPDLYHRLSEWLDVPDLPRWGDTRPGFAELIKIEQRMADGKLEIRAEVPGLDPDKDVDVSILNGILTITAERHEEEKGEHGGATFSEFRYGSFSRSVRVPEGTSVKDVKASYKDGILSVVVPMPAEKKPETVKVPISRK